MKPLIIITIALSLWLSATVLGQAQDTNQGTYNSVEQLNNLKEKIIQEEKNNLKKEVENINKQVETGNLDETEAEILKQQAAEKHALNIENRVAIINNKVALLKRNGILYEDKDDGITLRISSSRKYNKDGVLYIGNTLYIGPRNKKRKYDRRTTSGLVFAFGLNNVITNGESLQDSDFKMAGSRFAEIGWAWKTRVFQNTNWLRIKYGVSVQFNGLKPTDNRYYVDTGEQTELQTYPLDLKKSKFRMDNLVMPVFFEFGSSKKVEHDDYFRYSTKHKIKVGLGGYAGINLGARQKLKFKENGYNQKRKLKANYNTNNLIYGFSAYIGWEGAAIYAKYDLNTIFKNNPVDQHNVSFGLRFDMY